MTQKPRHEDGSLDLRYRVSREYAGAPDVQYILRFCDDFISSWDDPESAWHAAMVHQEGRLARLLDSEAKHAIF